tara:strand:+ start:769 stop:1008 length:240 start_codon:yes stop_codon:yes gene_type:complete
MNDETMAHLEANGGRNVMADVKTHKPACNWGARPIAATIEDRNAFKTATRDGTPIFGASGRGKMAAAQRAIRRARRILS